MMRHHIVLAVVLPIFLIGVQSIWAPANEPDLSIKDLQAAVYFTANDEKENVLTGAWSDSVDNTIVVQSPHFLSQKILAPLKQFKSGVPIDQIQCKDRFVAAIKSSSGNPVCVKQTSLVPLMLRDWAKITSFEITEGFFDHTIENAKILSMKVDSGECGFILLNIQTDNDGRIEFAIPKKIFDFDDELIVLLDGLEVEYQELQGDFSNTVSFSFEDGSKTVEILKTCLI
ncbi:MAG: hypothetical protein ACK4TO_03795 [Candidatus Nitrosotenuis sp.]